MPGWRLNPLAKLSWRPFGDEWVVFDGASGLTHAMSPLHAAVLTCIEQSSHDEASLAAALSAEYGLAADSLPSVQQVIEEFCAQGLIQARPI